MNRELLIDIQQQNPIRLAQLYVKYGVPRASLNPQTTADLITVYGDEFLYDLNTIYPLDSFFGMKMGKKMFNKKDKGNESGEKNAAGKKPKGQFVNKLKTFGATAWGLLNKGGDQGQGGNEQMPDTATDEIFGIKKPLFYGLCFIALALIVYALTKPKTATAI